MSGGYFLIAVHEFSLLWLLLLQSAGSRAWDSAVVVHRLSMPLGTWNRPRPEVELMSLALAGRFLITGPLGRFYFTFLNIRKY